MRYSFNKCWTCKSFCRQQFIGKRIIKFCWLGIGSWSEKNYLYEGLQVVVPLLLVIPSVMDCIKSIRNDRGPYNLCLSRKQVWSWSKPVLSNAMKTEGVLKIYKWPFYINIVFYMPLLLIKILQKMYVLILLYANSHRVFYVYEIIFWQSLLLRYKPASSRICISNLFFSR